MPTNWQAFDERTHACNMLQKKPYCICNKCSNKLISVYKKFGIFVVSLFVCLLFFSLIKKNFWLCFKVYTLWIVGAYYKCLGGIFLLSQAIDKTKAVNLKWKFLNIFQLREQVLHRELKLKCYQKLWKKKRKYLISAGNRRILKRAKNRGTRKGNC